MLNAAINGGAEALLKTKAEKVAADEGSTLNQLINVAVAEKRTARAKPDGFDRLMETACDEPPRPRDEILPGS